jgi:hypothetical protein
MASATPPIANAKNPTAREECCPPYRGIVCVLLLVHRRIVNPLNAVASRLDVRRLLDHFDLHCNLL